MQKKINKDLKSEFQQAIHWHGYINYIDTHITYLSLDSALVGCIGYKHEGGNGKAAKYFSKMVGME